MQNDWYFLNDVSLKDIWKWVVYQFGKGFERNEHHKCSEVKQPNVSQSFFPLVLKHFYQQNTIPNKYIYYHKLV